MTRTSAPRRRIAVFRTGHLGDTLVAIPAIRDLQSAWPDSEWVLLSDDRHQTGRATPRTVLEPEGRFAEFVGYGVARGAGGLLRRASRALFAAWALRRHRIDVAIYLAPIDRSRTQVARDRLLFRLAGATRLRGFTDGSRLLQRSSRSGLLREADLLRFRVSPAQAGPIAPSAGDPRLVPTASERTRVAEFAAAERIDERVRWLAVAPGTSMPSNRWPTERFAELIRRLVARHDVWPIVVGGDEDRALATSLVAAWGRGTVAAGRLAPRETAELLSRCVAFVGNDSGALHLAAAAGIPCVAVFSARDHGTSWHPYGSRHVVIDHDVPCRGCMLVECVEQQNLCTRLITIDEVERACSRLLDRT